MLTVEQIKILDLIKEQGHMMLSCSNDSFSNWPLVKLGLIKKTKVRENFAFKYKVTLTDLGETFLKQIK